MDSDKPVGRPSSFKPEYCQQLIEHMEKGLSFESFAGRVRVARSTLFEWLAMFPEFSDAVSIGKELSLLRWEECGMDMMLGKIPFSSHQIYALNMRNRFKWDQPADSIEEKKKPKQLTLNYDPGKRPKKVE